MAIREVKAVNPEHQDSVNMFLKWDQRYDEQVNQDNKKDIVDQTPRQERFYNRAQGYWSKLPKREQQNIVNHIPDLKNCY